MLSHVKRSRSIPVAARAVRSSCRPSSSPRSSSRRCGTARGRGPLHPARRVVIAVSEPFAIVGTGITAPFRAIGDWAVRSRRRPRAATWRSQAQNAAAASRRSRRWRRAELENDRLRALRELREGTEPADDRRDTSSARPTRLVGGLDAHRPRLRRRREGGHAAIAAGGLLGAGGRGARAFGAGAAHHRPEPAVSRCSCSRRGLNGHRPRVRRRAASRWTSSDRVNAAESG